MSRAPVAVTGMGCVCAAGTGTAAVFDALCAGTFTPVPASRLSCDALPYPFFGVDEALFAGGRRHSAMDTLTLARIAADEALAQANLAPPQEPAESVRGVAAPRLGVVVGTTAGTALHFLSGYAALRTGTASPFTDIEDFFMANPAMALASALGAQGPALTVSNACTSGADAVGLGMELIRQDRCDVVLCGGADVLSMVPHTGFVRLTVFSDQPCRPFDRDRTGLNLGEGAGMLVLESAARAARKQVLGYVDGYGAASDAHHFTAPHPEGRGLRQALELALADAGCEASGLAFVNAHATATRDNDRVEGRVLQTCLPGLPVWASKGATGHTLGAAGAIEAVLSLLALRAGTIPPSPGFAQVDPEIGVIPTRNTESVRRNRAVSLSLGFGGTNAALVVRAHREEA